MNHPEQWAVVYHCPDYEVSTHGRVRTRLTFTRDRRLAKDYHMLKPFPIRGYLAVQLYNYTIRITGETQLRSIQKTYLVHRLVYQMHVLKSEHATCPYLEHIDGNKQNNHVSNLRPKKKKPTHKSTKTIGKIT